MSSSYVLNPVGGIIPSHQGGMVPRFAVRLWQAQGDRYWRVEVIDRSVRGTSRFCDHYHRYSDAAFRCGQKTIRDDLRAES